MRRLDGELSGGAAMTFQEIGARLGISRQTAHLHFASGIRKLRKRPGTVAALRRIAAELEQARKDQGRYGHALSI